jgi:DNA polymerase III alpha subunit (gram-positive type)
MDRIVYLDIETTGLNPYNSYIIEIAVKDNIGNEWSSLIKSPVKLSYKIVELTRITDEMLIKDGIEIKEGLNKLLEFIEGTNIKCDRARWIIGHNLIGFDWAFIYCHFLFNKIKIDRIKYKLLDTYRMAQYLYRDEYQSYKLVSLCEKNGIKGGGFHRAMNDVYATEKLYNNMYKEFKKKGIKVEKIWEYTTVPYSA